MIETITDVSGYVASVFVVLSFVMRNVIKIRIFNLIGCVLFVLYAILKGWQWPVIIPNGLLCFVQIYYLAFAREKPATPVPAEATTQISTGDEPSS